MHPTHAFVDESARGQRYYVCAAVVIAGDVDNVRKLARSFCAPGQRRWHFVNESNSRRTQILAGLVSSGQVRGWVGRGRGDEDEIRRRCLAELAVDLVAMGGERLIIESRQGRDEQDRRTLYPALRESAIRYEHMTAYQDPGLWWADALAWTYGAGGQWRDRLKPVVDTVRDVGAA